MSIEDEDFDDNLDEEDDLEMNDDDKSIIYSCIYIKKK
jgi:hypothetical protein